MRLILFILLPLLSFSQNVSEFQFIQYNKTFIKDYDFVGGKDTLKSHALNYELVTTNLGVNDGVTLLVNNYRNGLNLDTVSKTSDYRISQKSVIDFAIWESEEILDNVILRQFGDQIKCDTCTQSIFDIIIEDNEICAILNDKNLKFTYTSYYQITFAGEYSSSYIAFYYKLKGSKLEAILLSLDEDL